AAVTNTTPIIPQTNATPAAAADLFQQIPAQAPVVTGLNATPPIPPGAGLAPTTVEPVTALASTAAATPVAATQSSDRSTTAGDRCAAMAEAGARVVATAPPHGQPAFNAVLNQQATGATPGVITPQAVTAPAATAAPTVTANVPVTIQVIPAATSAE